MAPRVARPRRQPGAGVICIDGTNLSSDGLADLRRERVGIIFQGFHLLPSLSALDNAALPLPLQMAGASGAREAAAEMLHRVGLGDRLHHRPSQLSGGEQQRVAIARAVHQRPRYRPTQKRLNPAKRVRSGT